MPDIHLIPLDAIADDALPRDRGHLDPAALAELRLSILRDGLRQPVELVELEAEHDGRTHGLLAGLRRLTAFRALRADFPQNPDWAAIPAFIRPPAAWADTLRQMVEENDIRADIAPWDQARIAVDLVPEPFETVDAAVAALYRSADRQRRARIRAACVVVEELSDLLAAPHTLTLRRLERLSAACRGGFTPLLRLALEESRTRDPARQWRVIENVLREAEAEARDPSPPDPRPGRPRRMAHPRPGLTIRRERTDYGWSLHFTGREASGPLMEDIMDEVERLVGREG